MDIIKNAVILIGVLFILCRKGPLLVGLCFIGMVVEGCINQKIIGINTSTYKKQSLVERIFSYTMFELVDFKNAKDIRLYQANDMMIEKTGKEIDKMVRIEKERVDRLQPLHIAEAFSYVISQCLIYLYLGIRTIKGVITIGMFTQLLDATSCLGASLVGLNGTGKTTFIKFLCRLYEVNEGEILLEGVNIKEYEMQEYLKMLSVVFQDFQLLALVSKRILHYPIQKQMR